ncbi:hypothetical protein, partial [Pseudomonas aeruginosa]|uniref:hypothetical protein n=1 Tax=Pseudomonas aeruginosa TaxID=287 RepID=UPI003968C86C
ANNRSDARPGIRCTKRTFWPAEVNSLLELQPANSKAAPTIPAKYFTCMLFPMIDELSALARV